jgi:hypothetical protein
MKTHDPIQLTGIANRPASKVGGSLILTVLIPYGVLTMSASCVGNNTDGASGSGGSSAGVGGSGGSSAGVGGSGGSGAGVGGSGGKSGACTPGTNGVCFSEGKAVGLMTGYGFVALGSLDTITSPTCDTGTSISKATPCTAATIWSSNNALCMTGSIPALPASPQQSDYDNNWGLQVGANTSEPSGTALGSSATSYKTITLTVTGAPLAGLRAEIHRLGDPEDATYCAKMTSNTAINLTSFSTECYGGSNDVKLTTADIPKIDKISIQVSATSSAITVTDLCLTSIQFGS